MKHRLYIIGIFLLFCSALYIEAKQYKQYFDKACTDFRHQDYTQAEKNFKKAIALEPRCYQALYNLGALYKSLKKIDLAIDYFKKAIAINPTYLKAHIQLAEIYSENGNKQEAKHHYKAILLKDENNAEAHRQLGKIYQEETAQDSCIYHLEKAYKNNPRNIQVLHELANAKNINDDTKEALELYLKLNTLVPNSPSIIYNIAYTYKKLGLVQEAMSYYQKVLKMKPDHAEAHFSYGLALLITGQWEVGWKEYEYRWKHNNKSTLPNVGLPLWDGSNLKGKTIYFFCEQGLGDTFQFIRYVQVAKKQGARTIVGVQSALLDIIKLCPYIDIVIDRKYKPPHADFFVPLLSCPRIYNTTIDTTPKQFPYLYADEALVKKWKNKLSLCSKKLKVGMCWQGNPNYSTHFLRMAVAAKSMPLKQLTPLFNIPDIQFYSLQMQSGTDQIKQLTLNDNVTIFDESFDKNNGRFMDSAAVVKNLDLMITVDTSIGHFAAALGTPTWILLPNPPDWRWMLNCSNTPWYPHVKLFRQPTPGDWDSVIDMVAAELMTLLDIS